MGRIRVPALYVERMRNLFFFSAFALLLFSACSSSNQSPFVSACPSMDALLKEKKDVDKKVRETSEQVKDYRKAGDTASAASAERRLEGMLENQRLLKESLDESSRNCSPLMKDPEPVRDPASRNNLPK
jgi:predicted RNase H-like nuclease